MWTALRILALGAITATCSEIWFYPVQLSAETNVLILFYAAAAAIFLTAVASFDRTGVAGFVVAAGLFGIAVEGVPVPVLYSGVPFTILWTSLAWHALLTIGCGVVGFRLLLRWQTKWVGPILAIAGLSLGIWQGYSWSGEGGPDDILSFVTQFAIGLSVFIAGHVVLDLTAKYPLCAGKWLALVCVGVSFAMFTIAWLLPLFPISLIFPALMGLGYFSLSRGNTATRSRLFDAFERANPFANYAWVLIFAVFCIAGYALSVESGWETNVWWILVTGPIATLWWIWVHAALLRKSS